MDYTKNSETKSPFSFAYKKVLRFFIEDILVLLFTTEISVAKKQSILWIKRQKVLADFSLFAYNECVLASILCSARG